jgi:phytoene desaturase
MIRALPALWRTRAFRRVASVVEETVRDPRVRQALSFHPLLIGGNPFTAPAIYAMIHALEKRWGVWFARGGTGALVQALACCFTGAGGALRLGADVAGIEFDERSRRATGVRLVSGERLGADAVVCNADLVWTYQRLVPARFRPAWSDRRLARLPPGMSLFIVYFGTDRRYEHVAHHEILLGPRYRGLLDDVFAAQGLAPDFALYLHRPTATDRSLAPEGGDAFYVLSPVPHLGAPVNWDREGDAYRNRIIEHLEERLLPDLRRHIVTELRVDPRYFRDQLNAPQGGAFSVEPLLTRSAWFRPHSVSDDVPNLYFVGAGTHPGAGVPGVLSSAKIVADLIG